MAEAQPVGIYRLPYEALFDPIALAAVYADTSRHYYWSDDFSAAYYIAQAQRGFIAVSDTFDGKRYLLPEIQFAYAVLHFDNLHVSRHVRRILKRDNPPLIITEDISFLTPYLRRYHRDCWLDSTYEATLKAAHEKGENFTLTAAYIPDKTGTPIAGEIGYSIGRTYTSLSGFSSKEARFRNYGTAQMVLLARHLQSQGYAFWNLGHPYMQYKFSLGAVRYDRADFLALWYDAVAQDLPS